MMTHDLFSGAWAVVGSDGTVTIHQWDAYELMEARWWSAFKPRFHAILVASLEEWYSCLDVCRDFG